MEEVRENKESMENTIQGEVIPGVVAAENQQQKDVEIADIEQPTPATEADIPPTEEDKACACKKKKRCFRIAQMIFDVLVAAGLITLFILHFCGGKSTVSPVVSDPSQVGNGDILYVNIDTINVNYEMVSLLTDSIDVERQKQTVLFQNRQKALENKLANYQRQMQAGQLTAQQAQYAEQSLQQESTQLQNDYSVALESLEARYTAALNQIADSLRAAVVRANARHNASFVISYGAGGQVIVADPSKDITQEVLDDLNKPFKKKRK